MVLKRVVVTGLGALTPIGNNIQEYWNALINGVSGLITILILLNLELILHAKNFNAEDFF
jgi:3-oxoacyl-[acyl-carrier-protein] synthase II